MRDRKNKGFQFSWEWYQ